MAIALDYSSGIYLASSSDTYKKDKIKEHKSKDKYKETTVSYNNGYSGGYNSGPTIVVGPGAGYGPVPSYVPGSSYVNSYYYGISWATIIIGAIIIVLAAVVMVFFERKVKARNRVFKEMLNIVQETGETFDPSLNGQLIYTSGCTRPTSTAEVKDDMFPFLSFPPVYELTREVRMYQWKEKVETEERQEGDRTITERKYTYETKWSRNIQHSYSFAHPHGHENPGWDDIFTTKVFRSQAALWLLPYEVDDALLAQVHSTLKFRHFQIMEPTKEEFKSYTNYELYSDEKRLYLSPEPKHEGTFTPYIGDFKIKFRYKPADMLISVMAVQQGSKLEPYQGYRFIHAGKKSPSELVEYEIKKSKKLAWAGRGIAIFLAIIGINCILFF